jgi:hypothetical protein
MQELHRLLPLHYLTILYESYCLTTVNYIPVSVVTSPTFVTVLAGVAQ